MIRTRPVVPSVVLGTALLLFTEVMLFGGMIAGYAILRAMAISWPPAGQPRLPVAVTGANSLLLFAGGLFMWSSVPALEKGVSQALSRVIVAATLGAAFLAVQGFEWMRLVSFGLKGTSSLYGALFYWIIGLHSLHVAGAIVVLAYMAWRLVRQSADDPTASLKDLLLAVRLYWSFVVLLWPILYVLVYLS